MVGDEVGERRRADELIFDSQPIRKYRRSAAHGLSR